MSLARFGLAVPLLGIARPAFGDLCKAPAQRNAFGGRMRPRRYLTRIRGGQADMTRPSRKLGLPKVGASQAESGTEKRMVASPRAKARRLPAGIRGGPSGY